MVLTPREIVMLVFLVLLLIFLALTILRVQVLSQELLRLKGKNQKSTKLKV